MKNCGTFRPNLAAMCVKHAARSDIGIGCFIAASTNNPADLNADAIGRFPFGSNHESRTFLLCFCNPNEKPLS